ncbi:proteasome activator complex subunit 3 isoform 2-T2 [Leptosomus discolor]
MASLLKVDPEVKLKVDSFRERITSEAEDLVANFFPKKLLELDGFLKEPILNIHDLTQIHSDMNLPVPDPILLTNSHDGLDGPNMKKRKLEDREETFQGTKVFVMPNGMLKSNQQLVDIIEKVKPEIRLLIEKCNTVKMWVQLLIPRIEDGNNFGVSIQVRHPWLYALLQERAVLRGRGSPGFLLIFSWWCPAAAVVGRKQLLSFELWRVRQRPTWTRFLDIISQEQSWCPK